MMQLARVMGCAGMLALSACSTNEGGETDTGAPAAAAPASSSAEPAGGGATSMRVVLTGGPKPGSYDKQSADPTCTVGYAAAGGWGNAANDLDDTSGLIGIDLVVPKPEAAKSGTSDFMMTVYVDDRNDPKNQFTINPPSDRGSGTATIDDRGSTARVTVRGTTKEGVGVDATIECRQVLRG